MLNKLIKLSLEIHIHGAVLCLKKISTAVYLVLQGILALQLGIGALIL